MTHLAAKAEGRQIYVCESKYGRLSPIATLDILEAEDLLSDLRVALDAARKEDLVSKKARLAALQSEIARLEAATL